MAQKGVKKVLEEYLQVLGAKDGSGIERLETQGVIARMISQARIWLEERQSAAWNFSKEHEALLSEVFQDPAQYSQEAARDQVQEYLMSLTGSFPEDEVEVLSGLRSYISACVGNRGEYLAKPVNPAELTASVDAALAALDPRQLAITRALCGFGALRRSVTELADNLEITPTWVRHLWNVAKRQLRRQIQTGVRVRDLWREVEQLQEDLAKANELLQKERQRIYTGDDAKFYAALAMPVNRLAISQRAKKALAAVGVIHVAQLAQLTVEEFTSIHNIGGRSVREAEEALAALHSDLRLGIIIPYRV